MNNRRVSIYEYLKITESYKRDALLYFDNNINLDRLFKDIDSLAYFLKKIGVCKNDVVSIMLPNMPESVVAFYATNKIGGIVNMIHPKSPALLIKRFLQHTKSKYIFVLEQLYQDNIDIFKETSQKIILCSISDYMPKIKRFIYDKYINKDYINRENTYAYSECLKETGHIENVVADNDTACYLHSGGTTGIPKTVVLTNYSFNSLAYSLKEVISTKDYIQKDSTAALILPLFHGFGLGVGIHTFLTIGIRVFLIPQFDLNKTVKKMYKYKTNILIGVPKLYQGLLDNKTFKNKCMQDLDYCFVGGDKCDLDLLEKYNEQFNKIGSDCKLQEGYGLTETVTVCSLNRGERYKLGSIGQPLQGMEMKVVDNEYKEVSKGEKGEIIIKGPTLMLEYLNDPDATNKVFITLNGEQWVKTGDIATLDKDGEIHFVERKKRIIRIASMNVYPVEIERIAKNIEGVSEACCVPFIQNKKTYIRLFVVLNNGLKLDDVFVKKIKKQISIRLLKYSMPKDIVQIDEMPLTKVGKVDFKKLEEFKR